MNQNLKLILDAYDNRKPNLFIFDDELEYLRQLGIVAPNGLFTPHTNHDQAYAWAMMACLNTTCRLLGLAKVTCMASISKPVETSKHEYELLINSPLMYMTFIEIDAQSNGADRSVSNLNQLFGGQLAPVIKPKDVLQFCEERKLFIEDVIAKAKTIRYREMENFLFNEN